LPAGLALLATRCGAVLRSSDGPGSFRALIAVQVTGLPGSAFGSGYWRFSGLDSGRSLGHGATLIAALEGILRLYRHKDGALITLADYLHRRTRGLIGSLPWLIRDASCQAKAGWFRPTRCRAT
jgi:hypothetical protein